MAIKRMGYKEALDWLLLNDDNEWLIDVEYGSPSVAACLVADIYQGGDTEKVTADLKKKVDKE